MSHVISLSHTSTEEELFNNKSNPSEFIIWGFSSTPQLQPLLFLAFLIIYLLTVFGNFTIIALIFGDTSLLKPMYCFLCIMSFLDFSYNTAPYLLYSFATRSKNLSFTKCMIQLYFFNSFASTEYLLLTTMAYDRYLAICRPLFYSQVMNKEMCFCLAAAAWSADTLPVEITMFSQGVVLLFSCFLLTVMSYVHIISAILKIKSAKGRRKTFSTCASHLTVVVLVVCVYMKPTSSYSLDQGKFLSVLYVNIIPMLNQFIYSLRNKDAFKKMIKIKFQKKKM
uniref:G-protein coupled receptors family 1 profile domain-containing protein n=1 Tax=Pyxicephalus adspersus TaxID=30357 RepID=A0AAV2ZFE1_PYXAD|nr:TPA: hypothetical protein GDO54_004386 [Pyxicephalus adspersus]